MNACEELDKLLAGGDIEVVWHGLTAAQWRSLVAPYRERAERAEQERDTLRLQLRTERAERMTVEDDLAALRARVTEYLALAFKRHVAAWETARAAIAKAEGRSK